MSETIFFTCEFCKQSTDVANYVMPLEDYSGFECVNKHACERRQKRYEILAEQPVHPVDRVTRLTVLLCGIFLGAVSAIGISYLWLGI